MSWLEKVSKRPQIVHVFGLRQTGKTTLMDAFRAGLNGHLHYPFQDYTVLQRYQSNIGLWIEEIRTALSRLPEHEVLHVFIDEVQKVPDLFQALQGLYDAHKGKVKFWIWGSSARPLKKHRAETLAGRFVSRTLHPLSQSEILATASFVPHLLEIEQNIDALSFQEPPDYSPYLQRCLRHTLLPDPFLLDDDEFVDDILQFYQASYIENEIRRENLVADVGIFGRFLTLAAAEDTTITNYSSLAKDLGISSNTIKTYYDILRDTFLTTTCNPYSRRLRVQVSKSPKTYFSDAGLGSFVAGNRSVPPQGTARFGALFESFVHNEIIKQIEYAHLPWRLSFLRTKTGKEIDLLISDGSRSCAVEIKATSKVTPEHYKHLQYLMSLDPTISQGIVISLQPAPLRLTDRIINVPVWNL